MRRPRQDYLERLRKSLKYVPPAALYGALIGGLASMWPAYWFSAAGAFALFYSFMAISKRRDAFRVLALLSWGLLAAGLVENPALRWMHMLYLPLVLFASAFFSGRVLAFVLASVPLLEARHIHAALSGGLSSPGLHEELALLGLSAVTAALALLARRRLEALRSGQDEELPQTSALEGEPDEEIRDVLKNVMYTVRPDSVSLFLNYGGELALRCTSQGELRLLREGLVQEAVALRQSIVSNRMRKERYGPGYAGLGRVASMAASPVMDGSFVAGVLVADSEREGSFTESKVKAMELYARQISKTLGRKRIQSRTEEDLDALRALQDESACFVSSLELEKLVEITVDTFHNVLPVDIVFVLKKDDSYFAAGSRGLEVDEKVPLSLENTVAETAMKERHPNFISDLRSYPKPALPFLKEDYASAFILPLLYQDDALAVVVFLSRVPLPLSSHQMHHLRMLGNQAATSIKNALLHEDIKRMADTDGLTGLFNHKHFHGRLIYELSRYQRTRQSASLLLIDIDFFKKINDTYGHPAGDAVLRGVAGMIKKAVRDIDCAARYGGEEFAALLIDTGKRGAGRMAERLRRSIQSARFEAEGHTIGVTVSIGIASCPDDSELADDLVSKADKALYQAKESGRNRVVLHGG